MRFINQIGFFTTVGTGLAVYVSLLLFCVVLYLKSSEPGSGEKDGHKVRARSNRTIHEDKLESRRMPGTCLHLSPPLTSMVQMTCQRVCAFPMELHTHPAQDSEKLNKEILSELEKLNTQFFPVPIRWGDRSVTNYVSFKACALSMTLDTLWDCTHLSF